MSEREWIVEALREAADAMHNLAMLDFCGTTWLYRSGICRSAAALLTAQPEDVGERICGIRLVCDPDVAPHMVHLVSRRETASLDLRTGNITLTRHPTKEAENG